MRNSELFIFSESFKFTDIILKPNKPVFKEQKSFENRFLFIS